LDLFIMNNIWRDSGMHERGRMHARVYGRMYMDGLGRWYEIFGRSVGGFGDGFSCYVKARLCSGCILIRTMGGDIC
jgi:hypothetical protein